MKLTTLRLTGVKNVPDGHVLDLGDVTLITGPNGSGKTAMLASIAYAITGRFPGVGETAEALGAIVACSDKGMEVVLSADNRVTVRRGLSAQGEHTLSVDTAAGPVRGGAKAHQAAVERAFGDTAFFVDAFDAERSVWRLSHDKFHAWAAGLCMGASSWTEADLIGAVGPATDDWRPGAHKDPAVSLDINIQQVSEALRAAQKVARDGATTADSISAIDVPTAAEVEHWRHTYDDGREKLAAIRALYDRVIEQRPVMPMVPVSGEREILEAESRLTSIAFDMETANEAVADAADRKAKAEAGRAFLDEAIRHIQTTKHCPVCTRTLDSVTTISARAAHAAKEAEAANGRLGEARRELTSVSAEVRAAERHLGSMKSDWQSYEARLGAYKIVEAAWEKRYDQAQLRSLIGTMPIDEAMRVSSEVVASAKAEYEKRQKAFALSGEVRAQREAEVRAKNRADELKDLLGRLKGARDSVLRDSIRPLRDALGDLARLAPSSAVGRARPRFAVRLYDGKHLAIGVEDEHRAGVGSDTFIPYQALSAGEKMRTTIALLIARARVRREPWVGIMVDGFESVFPESERAHVLEALVLAAKTGYIDNALVVGAMDPVEHPGVSTCPL